VRRPKRNSPPGPVSGRQVEGAPSRDTVVVVSELFQQAQRTVLIAGHVVYDGRRIF